MEDKFKFWKGIDREEIVWNPVIDKTKCKGCGMCVTSCGRNVFDFDYASNNAVVARPQQCMVGCTSCEVWCLYGAITFPDKTYVKRLIKENKVIEISKNELNKRKPK